MKQKFLSCVLGTAAGAGMIFLPMVGFALVYPGEPLPLRDILLCAVLLLLAWAALLIRSFCRLGSAQRFVAPCMISSLIAVLFICLLARDFFRKTCTDSLTPYRWLTLLLNLLALGVNAVCIVAELRRAAIDSTQ